MNNMNKTKVIQSVTLGALYSIISTIFQTAPVYMPVVGLLFSPLSTLPVIISGLYSFTLALFVYLCSSFLILLVSLEEALFFIFSTGLIGLGISIFIKKNKPITTNITSTIFLTFGILMLTYIFQITSFIEFARKTNFLALLIIAVIFSSFYSFLLQITFKKIKKYLHNINKTP